MKGDSQRKIGLARAISKLGYCSRSQAVRLIRAGRVQLNGEIQCDPEEPVRLHQDRILIDENTIDARAKIYLMMNKPRGLVTTASDEKGRRTIYSILEGADEVLPWLSPVGRLDKASEGLLLLTNDSEWGARIAAPETRVGKTYHVQVGSRDAVKLIPAILRGVRTEQGELLRTKQVRLLRSGQKNCWLEITLDEGKNRHIRRIFETFGIEVLRLLRVAIGSLQLGDLPKGVYRHLTAAEKLSLDRLTHRNLECGKTQGKHSLTTDAGLRFRSEIRD